MRVVAIGNSSGRLTIPTAPPSAPDVAARTLWMRRPRLAGTLGRVVSASCRADLRAARAGPCNDLRGRAREHMADQLNGTTCEVREAGHQALVFERSNSVPEGLLIVAGQNGSARLGICWFKALTRRFTHERSTSAARTSSRRNASCSPLTKRRQVPQCLTSRAIRFARNPCGSQ